MNAILITLLLLPGSSRDSNVRTFNKLYAKVSEGYKKKDLSLFMAMTAPDFHVKLRDGHMLDRTQTKDVMQRQLATYKEIKDLSIVVDKVEMKGNTATVH